MSQVPETPEIKSDVSIRGMGSLWRLYLLTEAATRWADDHLAPEDPGRESTATIVADWRMGRDIVEGMKEDGLTVG